MKEKKLSIITINRNNADGLRKTMESVFTQTYKDFEYIVVDGASTDGSVEVIKDYVNRFEIGDLRLENFRWISEPDTGIYNAMNKGIEIAQGVRVVDALNRSTLRGDKNKGNDEDAYVLMLNSGDYLVDEHVIERIIPELHTEDMIQGNLIEDFPNHTLRFRSYGHSDITFLEAFESYFPHQATFIKLDTVKKYGYYDESYKLSADTYFFITALALGDASFRYVDVDVSNYDLNGISSMRDDKWRQIDKEENARWFGEHFSPRFMQYIKTSQMSTRVYESLHRHKWIWRLTSLLVRISEWITPTPPSIKTERII